jgi:hypothetical protein
VWEYKEAVAVLKLYVTIVLSHLEEASYKRIKADHPHFRSCHTTA